MGYPLFDFKALLLFVCLFFPQQTCSIIHLTSAGNDLPDFLIFSDNYGY